RGGGAGRRGGPSRGGGGDELGASEGRGTKSGIEGGRAVFCVRAWRTGSTGPETSGVPLEDGTRTSTGRWGRTSTSHASSRIAAARPSIRPSIDDTAGPLKRCRALRRLWLDERFCLNGSSLFTRTRLRQPGQPGRVARSGAAQEPVCFQVTPQAPQ